MLKFSCCTNVFTICFLIMHKQVNSKNLLIMEEKISNLFIYYYIENFSCLLLLLYSNRIIYIYNYIIISILVLSSFVVIILLLFIILVVLLFFILSNISSILISIFSILSESVGILKIHL